MDGVGLIIKKKLSRVNFYIVRVKNQAVAPADYLPYFLPCRSQFEQHCVMVYMLRYSDVYCSKCTAAGMEKFDLTW